jgi:tetratricopeptide (TPR) repeat protein
VNDYLKIVINRTGNKFILILIIFFFQSISYAFSQGQQSKPTRQSAVDAFSKGNYELANIQFNELSAIFPKDPLYKYYCGVSLVKLERDPVKALALLKEARQGSAAIRTIPSDALFYLGRAQQQSGNFSEAIKSYNLYTEQVGKKIAKEILTPQFIQQCNERKGEIITVKTITTEIIKRDSLLPVIIEKNNLAEEIVNLKPDTNIKAEKPFPEGYEMQLNEALNYQFRADSLLKLADFYRRQSENTPVSERASLKTKISEIEKLAAVNQKLANVKMLTGSGVMKDTLLGKKEEPFPKAITQKSNNQFIKDTIGKAVTKEKILQAQPKPLEIYSIFQIVTKPVYAANEKVKVNPDIPAGLIYRIQLAVFRNPVSPVYFKGITPVYGFKGTGSEVTTYYAGLFRKSADASKALVKVKTAGFKDAFVVALLDKKIVSAERAAILEKEWGKKTLPGNEVKKIPDAPRDTIPPTLIFRVEVTKSQKPLNTSQLDNIKKLAGNRGLDILKNASGQNIYLIGKFITFESAAEYADLLIRNGQKDAKVTAYLGMREIPVETAKQLFEKF